MTEAEDPRLTDEERAVLARMQKRVAEAKAEGRWDVKEVDPASAAKYAWPLGADADGNVVTHGSVEEARSARDEPPADDA